MTAYTITELVPVNQYAALGYSPPFEQTPAVFGSVADDSDATFTTLEAEYQPVTDDRYSEVLTLDFVLPDPTVIPAFYYMKIRARDNAEFVANPGRFVSFTLDYSAVADPPGTPFDSWHRPNAGEPTGQFAELAFGLVTDPAWFPISYVGSLTPVDEANPSADSWFPIDNSEFTGPVPHATYAALAGGGLRFTLYPSADSSLDPRTAYLDVFEVRMVVAYAVPSGRVPPLRLHPRSDGRGASSAARVWPRPPTGNYGRVGPGSLV